jgi:hypothetical protein
LSPLACLALPLLYLLINDCQGKNSEKINNSGTLKLFVKEIGWKNSYFESQKKITSGT